VWNSTRSLELAESGAGDQTILDIAGHVSKQMLKHYSRIRTEAKRRALESIIEKPAGSDASDEHALAERSLQSCNCEGHRLIWQKSLLR
jgi:hypothetical protein